MTGQGDAMAAHGLRTRLMEAISSMMKAPSDDLRQEQQVALADRLSSHMGWTSKRVYDEVKGLLKDVNETQMRQRDGELYEVVKRFLNASIELNSQYPCVKLSFRYGLRVFKFTLGHPLFVAHRSLKLTEDPGDDCPTAEEAGLAGRPIDMVVEPLVRRLGDADGENYDNERELLKAVVWMARPEDSTPRAARPVKPINQEDGQQKEQPKAESKKRKGAAEEDGQSKKRMKKETIKVEAGESSAFPIKVEDSAAQETESPCTPPLDPEAAWSGRNE
jgi:hypothetical protein